MRTVILLIVAGALAGCSTTVQREPLVAPMQGPKFAADRFVCPGRPAVPGTKATGDAAIRRDLAQTKRGDVCQSKLDSVGRELGAAGQVVE